MLLGFPILQIAIRVGAAVLVFLLGRWLASRSRRTLEVRLAATTIAPSMARLLVLAVHYGIMLLVVIFALAVVGVPLQSLLSASLVIVVVLGFALKESLSNLAATIIFMLFEPFRVGEQIEANGVLGTVNEIQLLSTVLVTGENKVITIPNSEIQSNNLINYTRLGSLRLFFVFRVSYAADTSKVKELLREILTADARVLSEPVPLIFVQSLDENGVSIAARPMVKPEDYWSLLMDIPERVKIRFDTEGINIPFPQRDVHLHTPVARELVQPKN